MSVVNLNLKNKFMKFLSGYTKDCNKFLINIESICEIIAISENLTNITTNNGDGYIAVKCSIEQIEKILFEQKDIEIIDLN